VPRSVTGPWWVAAATRVRRSPPLSEVRGSRDLGQRTAPATALRPVLGPRRARLPGCLERRDSTASGSPASVPRREDLEERAGPAARDRLHAPQVERRSEEADDREGVKEDVLAGYRALHARTPVHHRCRITGGKHCRISVIARLLSDLAGAPRSSFPSTVLHELQPRPTALPDGGNPRISGGPRGAPAPRSAARGPRASRGGSAP
jgi:hypothetical protein